MREPRFDVGHDTPLLVDLGKMERGGLDSAFFVVYVGQGPLTPEGYAHAVAQADRKFGHRDDARQVPRPHPSRATPAQVRDNRARAAVGDDRHREQLFARP